MKTLENKMVELDVFDIIHLEYFLALGKRKQDEIKNTLIKEKRMAPKDVDFSYLENEIAYTELSSLFERCREERLNLQTTPKL